MGHSSGVRDSWQRVMLTYVDWIAGRRMWFSGGDGIGLNTASPSRWHSRLNLNIGFYF